MTHPAALAHPNPESILVIGGGDGGSSEELLKHPSVKRIVMAELDPVVIDISKKWLGAIHNGAFDDPRLEVKIGDGFEFVKSTTERFDMIVLDLTDPDTPAFHLYSEQFFRMCQRILRPGGMLTLHLGSPVYQAETVRKNAANLRKVFRHVAPMSLFVPLYGSLWCLAVASDTTRSTHVRLPRSSHSASASGISAACVTTILPLHSALCLRCRCLCRSKCSRKLHAATSAGA